MIDYPRDVQCATPDVVPVLAVILIVCALVIGAAVVLTLRDGPGGRGAG